VCHSCGHRSCARHDVPWHSGETCAQFEQRVAGAQAREQEQASEKWKAGETRLCPKCRIPIEKDGGCDSMWCECSPYTSPCTLAFRSLIIHSVGQARNATMVLVGHKLLTMLLQRRRRWRRNAGERGRVCWPRCSSGIRNFGTISDCDLDRCSFSMTLPVFTPIL
jgi:hypothetical protein